MYTLLVIKLKWKEFVKASLNLLNRKTFYIIVTKRFEHKKSPDGSRNGDERWRDSDMSVSTGENVL